LPVSISLNSRGALWFSFMLGRGGGVAAVQDDAVHTQFCYQKTSI